MINAEESIQEGELFDRIICNCGLMITENPKKMMENLNRQSKQGCLFGLSVWGNKLQNNLFAAIRDSIIENDFKLPAERSNFHLYKKVANLAEQTGWEVVLNW